MDSKKPLGVWLTYVDIACLSLQGKQPFSDHLFILFIKYTVYTLYQFKSRVGGKELTMAFSRVIAIRIAALRFNATLVQRQIGSY